MIMIIILIFNVGIHIFFDALFSLVTICLKWMLYNLKRLWTCCVEGCMITRCIEGYIIIFTLTAVVWFLFSLTYVSWVRIVFLSILDKCFPFLSGLSLWCSLFIMFMFIWHECFVVYPVLQGNHEWWRRKKFSSLCWRDGFDRSAVEALQMRLWGLILRLCCLLKL